MAYSITKSQIIPFSFTLAALALSACGGGAVKPAMNTSNTSTMNPSLQSASITKSMEREIAAATANGNEQEVLAILAQAHGENPDDAIVATRYGRALREDDQINAAIRTLAPHTNGANKNIEATTEMAMAQIAVGDFGAAENFASNAIEMNEKNARAYLAMGTAQDALGRHQDAEISFRQGLKHWKGDPTPILNNLALNLASQGHLEESLSLLEKALSISPNRMDLERNRRIIATLVETSGPRAPAPIPKPNETKKVEEDAKKEVKAEVQKDSVTPKKKPVAEKKASKEPSAETLNASIKQPAPAPKVEKAAVKETKEKVEEYQAPAQQMKTKINNLKTKSGSSLNE